PGHCGRANVPARWTLVGRPCSTDRSATTQRRSAPRRYDPAAAPCCRRCRPSYLVVALRVPPGGERRRGTRQKVRGTPDPERLDVLPVEEDPHLDSAHRRATRRGFPHAGPRGGGHVEREGRGAVVRAQEDHGRGRGLTGGDAVVLGRTVRYRRE